VIGRALRGRRRLRQALTNLGLTQAG
jgi:hypothetical protein